MERVVVQLGFQSSGTQNGASAARLGRIPTEFVGLRERLFDTFELADHLVDCVTILTTESNDLMADIHDRMPVVLPPDAEDEWLDDTTDDRTGLCRSYPGDDLGTYGISTRVNDPRNDPFVIEPLGHDQSGLDGFSEVERDPDAGGRVYPAP